MDRKESPFSKDTMRSLPLVPRTGSSFRFLVPMRQKVVPRARRVAIAGFIRPPLQLGLLKPGTNFRHEVLVLTISLLSIACTSVVTDDESATNEDGNIFEVLETADDEAEITNSSGGASSSMGDPVGAGGQIVTTTASGGSPGTTHGAGSNSPDPLAPANIQFFGRFNFSGDTAEVGWNGSSIKVYTDGGSLSANFGGVADWDVIVDGGTPTVLSTTGVQSLGGPLLTGPHVIELHKRSEGRYASATVGGFAVQGGNIVAPTKPIPPLSIEFFGDSWLAGYGATRNGDSSTMSLSWNGSLSYGPIAARALGAEYHQQAWGGEGWTTGFPEDKAKRGMQHDATDIYDTSRWRPDLVVVEMGKNDGHTGIVQPALAFIDWLFESYGSDVAIVIVAVDGVPIYDEIYDARKTAENNIFLYKGFMTGTDVPLSGQVLGHPSKAQHEAMAVKLHTYLSTEVLPNIVY